MVRRKRGGQTDEGKEWRGASEKNAYWPVRDWREIGRIMLLG